MQGAPGLTDLKQDTRNPAAGSLEEAQALVFLTLSSHLGFLAVAQAASEQGPRISVLVPQPSSQARSQARPQARPLPAACSSHPVPPAVSSGGVKALSCCSGFYMQQGTSPPLSGTPSPSPTSPRPALGLVQLGGSIAMGRGQSGVQRCTLNSCQGRGQVKGWVWLWLPSDP